MLKSFKYRIYPNQSQSVLIEKHFGCTRYIYNWGLNTRNEAYLKDKTNLNYYKLSACLKSLKTEYPWLKEVNSQSIQQALINLDNAFNRFFRLKKGFPKFKSKKDNHRSFQIPQFIKIDFTTSKISIPKIKNIKTKFHRIFEGIVRQATVSKTPTGKYFISILVDTFEIPKPKKKIKEKTSIGIDLGIKDFAVISTGEKFENPKFLRKSQCKLVKAQRKFFKTMNGGKNRNKQRIKIAKIYETITNQKRDFLHKLTYSLTHDNQVETICMEDLNVSGMLKNHKLSRAISEVSWSEFKELLKYKCEWYGKHLIFIGRFEPSSRMCSCGAINKSLTLKDRSWVCPSCEAIIEDRDIHASLNIKKFALHKQNLVGQVLPEFKPVEKSWSQTSSAKQEAPAFRQE